MNVQDYIVIGVIAVLVIAGFVFRFRRGGCGCGGSCGSCDRCTRGCKK